MAGSKEEALEVERLRHTKRWKVYSDRSEKDGRVGVAAVLYKNGQRCGGIQYHLRSAEEHTVYEAELVGIILGAELLR